MNRKVKSFTILLLGLLVASIYFSALTQGAVLSDQLIVTEGSYVKGKFLYTNSTHNDVLMAYVTLSVDEIWNDTNTLLNLVNFKVLYEFQEDGENLARLIEEAQEERHKLVRMQSDIENNIKQQNFIIKEQKEVVDNIGVSRAVPGVARAPSRAPDIGEAGLFEGVNLR